MAVTATIDALARNWVDIAIVVVVLLTMSQGVRRGFLAFSLDFLALVLSFLAALRVYQPLAAWIERRFGLDTPFMEPLVFVAVALAVGTAVSLLGELWLRALPPAVRRNPVNHLFGVVPGALNGVVLAAILLTLAMTAPLGAGLDRMIGSAAIGRRLVEAVTLAEAHLRPVFGEVIAELLTFQTVSPQDEGGVDLPFTVAAPTIDSGAEEEMLRLLNQERVAHGLVPLVMDEGLRGVARNHARDMFQRGYFSHFTPEKLSPFDRMHASGIHYLAAGENLALAPTVEVAHKGLMNSPGHRANILSPDFTRVGIGAMNGGLRGVMFAQEFAN